MTATHFCTSAYAAEQKFSQQRFTELQQEYKGQRWLMIFWSLDCPPCFKELALVQKFIKQGHQLPIVIVNADDSANINLERQEVIREFNLASLTHLYFEEGRSTQNRYIVDPSWYGELPRSYFIDKNGKLHGKSGLVKAEHLKQWFLLTDNKLGVQKHEREQTTQNNSD